MNDPRVLPAPSTEASGLHRAWELLRGYRFLAFGQTAVSFIEGIAEAAILTLFARLALDAVDDSSGVVYVPALGDRSLQFAFFSLIVVIAGRVTAGMTNNLLANRLQYRLVRDIRSDAIITYGRSSWTGQSRLDEGAIQQLIVTLPNAISNHLAGLILQVGHIVIMLAMLSYAAATDPLLTVILVFVSVLATFAFRPLRKWIHRRSAEALVVQRNLSSMTAELASMKSEAHAFALNRRLDQPLLKSVERDSILQERVGVLRGAVVPLYTTLTYLAVTMGLILLANTASNDFDRTGPILLVVLRSLSYGTALQQAASGIATLVPSMDLIRDRLSDLRKHDSAWGTRSLESVNRLHFDNVSFSYFDQRNVALEGVSVSLPIGTKIGIVGPSGSGKSTFIRLILGLIQPDSGGVLVNGRNLHEYDHESWGRHIGFVPQSPAVIAGTLRENLLLFRDGIDDLALWEALEIADFAQDVRAMPENLNTEIGAGSRILSGGQMQRLAIARAFAAKPSVVVLDEPTSAIDSISEQAVTEAIDRLPDSVTVIIVSHKPRILEGCEQILVIQDSRLTAVGTPSEILDSSAYYKATAADRGY